MSKKTTVASIAISSFVISILSVVPSQAGCHSVVCQVGGAVTHVAHQAVKDTGNGLKATGQFLGKTKFAVGGGGSASGNGMQDDEIQGTGEKHAAGEDFGRAFASMLLAPLVPVKDWKPTAKFDGDTIERLDPGTKPIPANGRDCAGMSCEGPAEQPWSDLPDPYDISRPDRWHPLEIPDMQD